MAEPNKPIEISEATRREMERICRRATAGRDVPDAVRDELYGHLEDKLLGYLGGEERLTEADAMILVREHFGRPEALRPILADVHAAAHEAPPDGPRVPFARRIAAGTVVLAAAMIGVVVFRVAVVLTPAVVLLNRGSDLAWVRTWFWAASIVGSLATAGCLFVARRRWLSPDVAQRAWVSRWKPHTFAVVLIALLLIHVVVSEASLRLYNLTELPNASTSSNPWGWVAMLLVLLTFAAAGLQCLAWIACTSSPARRTWWTSIVAAAAWVLYFPLWNAAATAVRLLVPGVWSTEFNPWTHLWEAVFASIVAGPALALYLLPRFSRWVKAQGPLRLRWAGGSTAG